MEVCQSRTNSNLYPGIYGPRSASCSVMCQAIFVKLKRSPGELYPIKHHLNFKGPDKFFDLINKKVSMHVEGENSINHCFIKIKATVGNISFIQYFYGISLYCRRSIVLFVI